MSDIPGSTGEMPGARRRGRLLAGAGTWSGAETSPMTFSAFSRRAMFCLNTLV